MACSKIKRPLERHKRRNFSLIERINLFEKYDALRATGKKKCAIAAELGISLSTMSTMMKEREKHEANASISNLQQKRNRLATYADVDKATFAWFSDLRSKDIPISGPNLQQKAREYAAILNHDDFLASTGWLKNFQKRCGIYPVKKAAVQSLRESEVKDLLTQYSKDDIFNADETALYYQLLPHRALPVKGQRCKGGKKSIVFITVLFCCNASGTEKMKPLVIGKYKTPRCLKNVHSLPCDYKAGGKALMTKVFFAEWLESLNRKMKNDQRNIVLLIDNCSAHRELPKLSNVRVAVFPPNCADMLQPLDQGIIHAAKAQYRKRLIENIIMRLASDNPELKVNILQAIQMLCGAWWSIKTSTILKCWERAGIIPKAGEDNGDEDCEPSMSDEAQCWRTIAKYFSVPSTVSFEDYISVDETAEVAEEVTDDVIIASVRPQDQNIIDVESPSDEEDTPTHVEHVSPAEAHTMMERIQIFLNHQEGVPDEIFQCFDRLHEFVSVHSVKTKQLQMTNYFSKVKIEKSV